MRIKLNTVIQLMVLFWTMSSLEPANASNIIADSVNLIKLIKDVTTNVLKIWDIIDSLPLDGDKLSNMPERQIQVLKSLQQMNDQIHHMEELQAEYFRLTIEVLKREFHAESLLAQKLGVVNDMTKMIAKRFKDMTEYQRGKDKLEPYTLMAFAEWSVKPGSNSLSYLVDVLHTDFFGDPDDTGNYIDSLFSQLVIKYEADEDQFCFVRRSPQQFAYDLYTKMALTELKAYIMMEYSWMTLRDSGKGNFSLELTLMRNHFDKRMRHSKLQLGNIMGHAGRVLWRCDPKPWLHVIGVSYDQVTRLLQGYVENEVTLSSESGCFGTCEDYQNVAADRCYANELCTKQPKCKGKLHSCRFIDADMSICQANNTVDSMRRYNYIEYDNGHILGDKSNLICAHGTDRAESWSRYLFWRCNYCFCLCDEDGPLSDRYFNLRDTLSDYQQNMIITGARFVKDQRVFHLQLQQGKLLPGGLINQSSLAWIPLESFDVTHVDIRKGFDYHMLSYDSRSIDLDEITAKNDTMVVTGARFRLINNHLNLEVRFSKFNFTTGYLQHPELNSYWQGNDKSTDHGERPRQKLLLSDPQLSTKSPFSSVPLSKDNQFMEFESSSMDKDAAQNTVPFIDIQEVVPNPAVPLSGMGIYHKGREGFGGFFAPKIVTYFNPQYLT